MSETPEVGSTKSTAILEPAEFAQYQQILAYLQDQSGLVQRARAALDQAEFVMRCVDAERIRAWRKLCETHGLDPDVDYTVDG
ncbi:MAG: hypothetical protein QGG69_05800, partial [Kiritimatiellia bacterium]|nr:hypothetical protein [Kiritimatiellia bacterium]